MSAIQRLFQQYSRVLFIIDAAHKVEEKHLREWLNQQLQQADFNGQHDSVVLPICKQPNDIDTTALASALSVSPETLLIPVRIVWRQAAPQDTKPSIRSLFRDNVNRPSIRKARRRLQEDRNAAQCVFGEPATLQTLNRRLRKRLDTMPGHINLTQYVASQAALALEVAERRVRGRRYKVPTQVTQQLVSHPRFQKDLLDLSQQTKTPPAELLKEAQPIFKELIAVPQHFWQDLVGTLAHKILNLGYETKPVVNEKKLIEFRRIVSENPSALLWTHKTHIDGIAVWSTLFDHDFPAPHMIGGLNMAFTGMGYLARRGGLIFIRRSFKQYALYKMILRQYIGYLLEKRFPLTWAFEGTRSRLGKLMPPRYGILKYVLQGAVSCNARNLHIIPIAISYDMIGDVKDYNREQSGVRKRPESLKWFLQYLRGLNQPMGRIYINFGDPIVFAEPPNLDDPLIVEKIAFQVGVETNRVTPVTLTALISFVLLGSAPRALTMKELRAQMTKLVSWCRTHNIELTDDFDADHRDHMLKLIDVMLSNGMLTRFDEGPEAVFSIAPEQHPVASYYRNNIVHHFVNKAIAELALLEVVRLAKVSDTPTSDDKATSAMDDFWREAERLRERFKFEFFYSPKEHFREDINRELLMYRNNWQQQINEKPVRALSILQSMQPLVAHSTLLQCTEAYRLVCDVAARQNDTQTLDEKSVLSATFRYAKQAYLQRRISSHASIAKLLFQNGFALLQNQGLVEAGEGVHDKRKALAQEFRGMSHRIERIRSISLPGQMDFF